MTVFTNFFGGAFFGGGFFGAGTAAAGHGSDQDGDRYDEPRRVMIAGKPFTVRSKGEYLALLRKFGRKDVPAALPQAAKDKAEAIIARAQETAREALQARQTVEIAALLHAKLTAEEARRRREDRAFIDALEQDHIPLPLLMMLAADL